ncbi:tyrosine-type recombinase/integrase [Pseudonocardia sichuanensis]
MARQPTPIGAHGKITIKQIDPKLWEARTRVRDPDGELRRVKRQGTSKTGAENTLKKALLERRHDAGSAISGSTRVREVGQQWLAHVAALVEAGDRSPRTYEQYESSWRLHILPAFGGLQLREVTPGRCEQWLQALRKKGGPSMCATARSVLSGVFGLAVRMDAIEANPVRDLSPIPGAGARKRKPRAMTAEERTAWLAWLDAHAAIGPRKTPARRPTKKSPQREATVIATRALGDITRFMLGTGCRIGEAMAVSWDEVDLEAGTVAICWHLVWVKGKGIIRLPGAKSEAGDRVLKLPSWCLDMLVRRRVDPRSGYPVFPDSLGGWRDQNTVMKWIRWSADQAGFPWVVSHVYRQTVISVLDDAELRTREVADHVGHAQIAQTQMYMQRRVASERAAAALEDLL